MAASTRCCERLAVQPLSHRHAHTTCAADALRRSPHTCLSAECWRTRLSRALPTCSRPQSRGPALPPLFSLAAAAVQARDHPLASSEQRSAHKRVDGYRGAAEVAVAATAHREPATTAKALQDRFHRSQARSTASGQPDRASGGRLRVVKSPSTCHPAADVQPR